ncbi:MAG: phage holin family protein [Anaeroplasma bactoclasticum]|nr:phage holin family protein [Anaeroplasma bactoclasticum]
MEYTSIPTIVLLCYLIGEIYKKGCKKEEHKKGIPLLVTGVGGILGIVIYMTNREMLPYATNGWMALEIGMMSGATSTGTNQVIKQIFKNKGEEKNEQI